MNEPQEREPYAREYFVRKQADEAARMSLDADPVTVALADMLNIGEGCETLDDWRAVRDEALTAAARLLRLAEYYDRMAQATKPAVKPCP